MGPKKPEQEQEPMNEAEAFAEETRQAGRLADLAGTGGGQFEGELVTLESIENQEVTVLDYKLLPSTFREGGTYVCFQARTADGKLIVVNTNAMVPVKGFANVEKNALPLPVEFFMQKPKGGGKPYWNMK